MFRTKSDVTKQMDERIENARKMYEKDQERERVDRDILSLIPDAVFPVENLSPHVHLADRLLKLKRNTFEEVDMLLGLLPPKMLAVLSDGCTSVGPDDKLGPKGENAQSYDVVAPFSIEGGRAAKFSVSPEVVWFTTIGERTLKVEVELPHYHPINASRIGNEGFAQTAARPTVHLPRTYRLINWAGTSWKSTGGIHSEFYDGSSGWTWTFDNDVRTLLEALPDDIYRWAPPK